MDDAKNKMKGFMKNLTASNSKFKGLGHVLGSSSSPSSSSPAPNHLNSRLIPPSNPNPKPNPRPNPKSSIEFNCPICSSSFPSESAVSAHVDLCLAATSEADAPAESSNVAEAVALYLSNKPLKDSVEVALRLLGNVVREPGNEKFRRIRMGNPKIKEAVGGVKGGVEMLQSVGFRVGEEEEGGEVWGTMEVPEEAGIRAIKEAVSLLGSWKEGGMKGTGGSAGAVENRVVEKKKIDRQVK